MHPNPPGNKIETKQKAKQLLFELDNMKGPAGLSEWNIRTQTFLIFEAMKQLHNPELAGELKGGE